MLTLRRNSQLGKFITTKPVVKPKRKYRPIRKRKFAKAVKSIMLKNIETKKQQWEPGQISISQGTLYVNNPLYQNVQGSGRGQHIGDEIFLRGFNMRINARTTNRMTVHLALVKSRERINDVGNQDWNATGTATFFTYFSVIANNAIFNPEQVSVVKYKRITVSPQYSTQSVDGIVKVYAPINRKFIYDGTTGFGKFYNYYWFMWVSAPGLGVDVATPASAIYSYASTYYKDP